MTIVPSNLFFLIWGSQPTSSQGTEGNRQHLAFIVSKNIFSIKEDLLAPLFDGYSDMQNIHYRARLLGERPLLENLWYINFKLF